MTCEYLCICAYVWMQVCTYYIGAYYNIYIYKCVYISYQYMYGGESSLRRYIAHARGWSVRYNIIAAARRGRRDLSYTAYIYIILIIVIYDIIVFYNAPFLGGKNRQVVGTVRGCRSARVYLYTASVVLCVVDLHLYTEYNMVWRYE